jgi:hypothetical protein
MRAPTITLTLLLATHGISQAGEAESRSGWRWHPSVQVFGSVDEIGDDSSEFARSLADVSPALGLAAACESAWEGQKGRAQASAFALLGSPFAGGKRTYFLSGRLHAVRELDRAWRLSLDDSARWQRREAAELTDFQRNEAVAGLEWRGERRVAVGLRVSDRRRSLPNVRELGFSRQGASVSLRVEPRRRLNLDLSAGWQHYSAITASGARPTLSAEIAGFDSRGVASARVAWFGRGQQDRTSVGGPATYAGPSTVDVSEGGVGTRSYLVENVSLEPTAAFAVVDSAGGTEADLTADPLLFDPLESESDEWDFGRRKLVLLGFFSRRVATVWQISAVARWQRRHGPSLLLGAGVAGPDFEDKTLAMRVGLRRSLTARLSALVQGCYLKGWADRTSLRFSRGLLAAGLQYRY